MTIVDRFELRFELNADYSGCCYSLFKDGVFKKEWHITYGWNTPAWQEQEKQDRARMYDDLFVLNLQELIRS